MSLAVSSAALTAEMESIVTMKISANMDKISLFFILFLPLDSLVDNIYNKNIIYLLLNNSKIMEV